MDVFTASPEVRYRMTFAPIRTKSADACVENNVQDEVRPGAGREGAWGKNGTSRLSTWIQGLRNIKTCILSFLDYTYL